jgi:hypothetical protein
MPIKYILIVYLFHTVDANMFVYKLDQAKIVCNYSIRNQECSFFREKNILYSDICTSVHSIKQN